jgi:hypothetical protein
VAVHARQLAFEPDLQIIRRSRRPLLRGLEQARRSVLAHHVPRIALLGARVLINGTRYKSSIRVMGIRELDATFLFRVQYILIPLNFSKRTASAQSFISGSPLTLREVFNNMGQPDLL